ncbi:MAG: sodium/solute symporter [Planctomycetota bacterium]
MDSPISIPQTVASLRAGDLATIAVYFVLTAIFAVYWGRRNKDTEAYFLGGRSVPGWAVGLSLIGTSISSVSFLALPAAAFALDWRLMVPNYMTLVGGLVALLVFVPLYRAMSYTTAYEFLEARVGRFGRLYCAVIVIFLQLLRIGAVLYLVSVPVSLLLGVPIEWVIFLGGLFIMLYTVFGGIEVVIWTDVVQTIVLWGGAAIMFVFIVVELPEGMTQGFARAWEEGKFSHGELDWDMTRRTLWTMVIVGAFEAVGNNASNQTVVQRIIAAGSTKEARKAVWISMVLSIPTWVFFYLVGTSLWVLYTSLPDQTLAQMTPEEIVPYFTLNYLPVGLTGLIIAAIMAAAMSSLDSSINAISTIGTTDIVRRYLAKDRDEKVYLRWAKSLSAVAGLLMIGLAFLIYGLPRESIVDLLRSAGSVLGGVVAGIFLLAIFTKRVGARAILTALPFALAFNLYCVLGYSGVVPEAWRVPVHVYWVSFLTNVILIVLALLFSLRWPRQPETPSGPTVKAGVNSAA